jgi:hypothetical protein
MNTAETDVVLDWLRKAATSIYIAVDKSAADDISGGLIKAANTIKNLREQLATCRELRSYDAAELARLRRRPE